MTTVPLNRYDLSIIIGRFEPVHHAHLDIIEEALTRSTKVLILIGSCNRSRSPKNPLNAIERHELLISAINERFSSKYTPDQLAEIVHYRYLHDYLYESNRWLTQVQQVVTEMYEKNFGKPAPESYHNVQDLTSSTPPKHSPIAIVGHKKDDSSFYLEKFPQWDRLEIPLLREGISSTEIRSSIFSSGFVSNETFTKVLPKATQDFFLNFVHEHSDIYGWLREEYLFEENYREEVSTSKWEYIRQTVDAVVTCKGHVLFGKRKDCPGKGLWALPGGHIGPGELLIDAAVRELFEETKLRVTPNVVWNAIRNPKYFDHPDRSQLCRTITQAFHIPLNMSTLPTVTGKDDLSEASWFSFAEMEAMRTRGEIFSDHGDIASHYINTYGEEIR